MTSANCSPDMMNSIIETENAKRKEIEQDLHLNMFVEAGAGAGKTYLITKRITNMLMQTERPVDPGEIVVITFTNAAAEELRNRIFKNIRREAANAKDEQTRARLREVKDHLDEMNISTIHSFCNVLLKEQAIAAGLPVDISVLEEDESNEIREKILNRYLCMLDKDEWERLESVFPERKNRSTIRNAIRAIYNNRLDQPEDIEVVMPDMNAAIRANRLLTSPDKDEYYEQIKSRITGFVVEKATRIKNDLTSFDRVVGDAKLPSKELGVLNNVINSADASGLYRWLALEGIGGKNQIFKKSCPAAYNKDNIETGNGEWIVFLKDLLEEVFPPAELGCYDENKDKSVKAARVAPLYQNILGIFMNEHAMKAADMFYHERPVAGLSNDRLLEETFRLICNETDDRALRYFSGKYKSLFVDEFQDTDSIQAGFIYRLASDPDDPEHERLRDGSLFVVGDPKQSIYRFRGAQPEVYFDIKARLKAIEKAGKNAKVYELQFNYRTNSKLINWINEVFEDSDGILKDDNGNPINTDPDNIMYIVDKDHPYIPMIPMKQLADDPKLIAGAYRFDTADSYSYNTETQIKEKLPEYKTDDDVEAVKNLIKTLIEKKYKITDYKENENGEKIPYPREIRPSDFLLMTGKTTKMGEYLDALKSVGISVKLAGKTDLSSDLMLITYVRIFRHLINSKDSFYRISAIEAIRESRLAEHAKDVDKYADELLDLLRFRTRGLSPYGVAEYLEKQISALISKNGDRSYIDYNSSAARIRQMLESLYEKTRGNGILMIRAMEEYINKPLEHELSLKDNSGGDDPGAVTFMNLHKTKGLEGKIVIIADRNGGRRWDDRIGHYRNADKYYPGYKYWFSASALKDENGETGYDKHRREEKAEFHRLEYVAVTRAEQAVIFMHTIKGGCLFANRELDKDGNLTDGYDYQLRNLPDIGDVVEMEEYSEMPPRADAFYDIKRDPMFAESVGDGASNDRHSAIYDKQSPSGLEVKESERHIRKEILKQAKAAGRHVGDEKAPDMKRPVGNITGNILHRTMELLVSRLSPEASDPTIKALAEICTKQAVNENMIYLRPAEESGEYTVDEVRTFITACAVSCAEWFKKEHVTEGTESVYTELPFSYYEEKGAGGSDNNVFMKGNADLIIRYSDGRISLIDYKSDNDWLIPEDRMADVLGEKYMPQLNAYRHMISKLFGVETDRISVGIISFSQKDEAGRLLGGGRVRTRFTDLTDHKK